MRRGTTDIGHECRKAMLFKTDQVRWRQIVCHDDLLIFLNAFGRFTGTTNFAGAAHQLLDDPFHHLHDISLALTQVGVVKGLELFDQRIHLLNKRPFGITATGSNQRFRHIDQLGILQDQTMHVDEGAHFCRRFRHVAA